MRNFSHKGSLSLAAIKGLVSLLARGVNISYYTSQKFNKVSPSSLVDVHTICLIGGTTLNCVDFIYFGISHLFFSLLDDSVFFFAAPPQ